MKVKITGIDGSLMIDPFDDPNIDAKTYIGQEGEAVPVGGGSDMYMVTFADLKQGSFSPDEFQIVKG